jgi:hypothetical protein
MKTTLIRLSAVTGLLAVTQLAQAASFSGHYPAGAEGIKGGSLPPPGFYLRDYNLFYWAPRFADTGPDNFDAFAYVQAPRPVWITEWKVLGGFYGMDALFPFYYGNVEHDTPVGRLEDDTFTLGDIFVEPATLSWHWKQFDLGFGYGFWIPNGDYNKDGLRPSRMLAQGFWTHMFTAGGTWYVDKEKTWALSLLNRYEVHTEKEDTDWAAGDTYTLEWGLSKGLSKTIEVGLVGYYQTQVTDYTGENHPDINDHVVGLGPEISTLCPKLGLFTSLRYVYELDAKERPQGHTVTLTFTKRF